MPTKFTNSELEAFLDESLPVERMAAIEDELRNNDALQNELTAINGRRDAGVHSLGDIWRRHRLSCPTREQLGSFLLGVLPRDAADYIKFHVESIEFCPDRRGLDVAGQAPASVGQGERVR